MSTQTREKDIAGVPLNGGRFATPTMNASPVTLTVPRRFPAGTANGGDAIQKGHFGDAESDLNPDGSFGNGGPSDDRPLPRPRLSPGLQMQPSDWRLREKETEPTFRAPEGTFRPEDDTAPWAREAIHEGALRRFGVTQEDYEDNLILMHNGEGGPAKARENLGLTQQELEELTASSNDLRNRKGPHFINGAGSRKDWAVLTASGLGDVPLEKTGKESVYRMAWPPGNTETIGVTDRGTLMHTDRKGDARETDGASLNAIIDGKLRSEDAPKARPAKVETLVEEPSVVKPMTALPQKNIWQRMFRR